MTDPITSDDVHGRLSEGLHHARDTAEKAYDSARDAVSDVTHRTVQGLDGNPLGILIGGLAVGALAGALIPRSGREKELLAPLGAKLGTAFVAAKGAALAAGQNELADLGISRDAARNQVKTLFDGFVQAATAAGQAGAKAAVGKSEG